MASNQVNHEKELPKSDQKAFDKLFENNLSRMTKAIEKEVRKNQNEKIAAYSGAIAILVTIVGFIGYGSFEQSVSSKLIDKYSSDHTFKMKVVEMVSDTLLTATTPYIKSLNSDKQKIDSLILEIEAHHDDLISYSTQEYKKTILVLERVRRAYEGKQ